MTERSVPAFVPLVDCAVLVAAREQGFAEEAGLNRVLVKEPSSANARSL
jgi:ABC-type nitrate/sulfonate/bicarbonate transport system substrate-binding protein